MKKLLVLLFLTMIGTSVYAQKSYVSVHVENIGDFYEKIYVSGDIPSGMKSYYNHKDDGVFIGQLLNMLSQEGYEVEFMSSGASSYVNFLLSKNTLSNQTQIEGDVNHDSEVNIADVNRVISLILGMLRDNPNLLEQLGIEQPK